MNCRQTPERWLEQCDGGAADAALAAHLAHCAACRAYVRQMETLLDGLRRLRAATDDPARCTDLAMPARSRRRQSPLTLVLYRLARVAAVVAFFVGSSWLASRNQEKLGHQPVTHPAANVDSASGITLHGASAVRFLAVAQPAAAPNVQVFWLYPTVSASKEESPPLNAG